MKRRWVWPLLIVLVWVFVGGPLGSFAGQLGSVQENDNAAFLPESSESTQVLETLTGFQEEQTVPTTVVFQRNGGLAGADNEAIAAYAEELGQLADVVRVQGPVPSEDSEAAQLVLQLGVTDGEAIIESVDEVRAVLDDAPEGLEAYVGGPGGITADLVNAFGAIDGLLLLVALGVVLVILVIVYRTPVLPFVVLFSSVLGLGLASASIYALASAGVIALSGQSQGILFILAIGAATDYSLLLVARFREELRDRESKYDAMRASLRAVLEPISASGATVILGLLCLLLSDLASLKGLGPVGAIGIAAAMLVSLTFLPAALVLLGRKAFWPLVPAYGSDHKVTEGLWGRVSDLVRDKAVAVASVTTLVLAVFAGFAFTLDEDPVPQTDLFLTAEESVAAQDVLDAHFDADTASPLQIVVPTDQLGPVLELVSADEGVSQESEGRQPPVVPIPEADDPQQPRSVDGRSIVIANLADGSETAAATATVERLRADLAEVDPDILVGGSTATLLDTRETTNRDRAVVIPTILVVIFLVLALLLRSLAAAGLLILANVLSFGATIGVSALVFEHVFDFPASDPSTLLIGFVFLVALGIDYSIFLMTRVREEALRLGTRPGILKGLSVTGGVITSAGVVLAATFAALGVVPIIFLAQIAFIVSFGVLLDTLVVRSLLVPAVCYLAGPRTWWPSALAAAEQPADRAVPAGGPGHEDRGRRG
ncbi:Putative membrane protein YdgH [Nocardioides dokdonensis FR1436]|uniref:Putative membrane protein YdgH n=1 Tax=Nocardioides dokdonensis FR1436 TaxID=1300347 RepID=A0A1A9GFB2_9ACTN|nr:MMPL family transporter [Nocardioides dokdonensis]ANH36766.1 Putative membrane protein YdgH [Nocardioides dokdonensis FR1436]